MITDSILKQAQRTLADFLTSIYNSSAGHDTSGTGKPVFVPGENFTPDKLAVEQRNDGFVEMRYFLWHCYLVEDSKREEKVRKYLKSENVHIQNYGRLDGLPFILARET